MLKTFNLIERNKVTFYFTVLFLWMEDREILLQEQLRQARESVSNMQKLHEYGQSQLFEFRARSGICIRTYPLHFFNFCCNLSCVTTY